MPPTPVERLIEKLEEGIVVGSRRHPASEVRNNQTLMRKFLGDTFSALASLVLSMDISDYQCGVKAVTSETWNDIGGEFKSDGFA